MLCKVGLAHAAGKSLWRSLKLRFRQRARVQRISKRADPLRNPVPQRPDEYWPARLVKEVSRTSSALPWPPRQPDARRLEDAAPPRLPVE